METELRQFEALTAFDRALDYTFANEGGFSNDTNDHGGATKFGITIGDLARWRKHPVSVAEVRALTEVEAKEIYRAWYWNTLALDAVTHANMAICMFDIGVVRGIGVSARYAQAICNAHGATLAVDSHIGPLTLVELNALDPETFIRDFSARAEAGFRAIVAGNHSQAKFLKGWVARARRLLTLIVQLGEA